MGTHAHTDPDTRHRVAERGGAGTPRVGRLAVALCALLTLALVLAARADAYVYWATSTNSSIGRANLDGSGVNQSFISGTDNPRGVAVDAAHVYWMASTLGTIGRANLDGTSVNQSFITGGATGFTFGVAVDAAHIYWTSFTDGAIGRANLDGSSPDQSFITGASFPIGLAVDATHVYWTQSNTGTIGRANLDGSSPDQSFITGASSPYWVAVDAAHIYWTNSNTGTIGRANLDGTEVDQSFITGANIPRGLAVDAAHVYWTNAGTNSIGRANLDASGVDPSFITSAGSSLQGLAVDGLSPPAASVSPRAVDFGDFQVGTATPARVVTVRNLSGLPVDLDIGAASISGTDPSSFGIASDTCSGQSLAPGGNCTISVEMTAASLGGKAASLSIPSNDPNSPATVALTGAGSHPDQSISPSAIVFGDQPVGTSSTSRTVTLTNEATATDPDLVGQAGLVAADAGQFSIVSDGCSNQAIAIGDSCEIKIAFSPTTAGAKQASLTIPSNDSTAPATVVLDGTGDAPGPLPPPVGPPLGPGPVLPGPATPSRPSNKMRLGKLARNRKKGTATLRVTVPGPGKLKLTGKLVKRVTKTVRAKGTTSLRVAPARKAKKALARRGKLKAKLRVAYTPTGGTTSSQTKRVTLTLRRGSRGRR